VGYGLVRALARFLLGLFYRRIDVVGREHVPARGPLIVAANHHNSLVDPMLLMATIPRRVVPLAAAPLFRNPLVAPFLRLVGALPVHRRQDAGDDPRKNDALFAAVTALLGGGGAFLIFPEGRTQPEPVLLLVRTGTARMLLAAESAAGGGLAVTLLPVGLVFDRPGTFRDGRALVLVGEPVPTADVVGLHGTAPEAAVRRLSERLGEALRQQIVEAGDRSTLGLLDIVEAVWEGEEIGPTRDAAARLAWRQRVIEVYRRLAVEEPERAARLRREVEGYARDSEALGLERARVYAAYPARAVLRYALREVPSLLLGVPLALWGMFLHVVPYQLTGWVVRRLGRTAEEEATDKIVAGVVLYPLAWIVEAWLAWRVAGGPGLAVVVSSLFPAGFFALAWRERLERVATDARALHRFLRDRDAYRGLLDRRRALAAELQALARAVAPPPDRR
jgi:1-acyl-sn-glycerol-3-phosphate acyltransferase